MSRSKWTLRPMSNTYHILSVNDFCKQSSLPRYNIGGQSPASQRGMRLTDIQGAVCTSRIYQEVQLAVIPGPSAGFSMCVT